MTRLEGVLRRRRRRVAARPSAPTTSPSSCASTSPTRTRSRSRRSGCSSGPEARRDRELAQLYEEHLAETRDHAELVEERLRALGGDPSTLKDAALRLGALNWGAFFRGHPDTPGKLAAFAYAFEHLEIGGYEQLRRVAERAGDDETAGMCESILAQERQAAERLAAAFPDAVGASLAAHGLRV